MFVGSPDDVLWRYLALRERLSAPASRLTVVDQGLVFGDVCANKKCRASSDDARLEEQDARSGASRWMCNACGTVWPVDLAFLLRNEFQTTPRPDASADLYARLGDYARILTRLLLREQRIYLLLYLYEGVGGYEEVAKAANTRWPTFRPPYGNRGPRPSYWTKHSVSRVVTDARKRINGELRHSGMRPRTA